LTFLFGEFFLLNFYFLSNRFRWACIQELCTFTLASSQLSIEIENYYNIWSKETNTHTHAVFYLLYKTLARNELRFQKQNTKKKIEESIKHERYIKVQLSVFFYSANSECLHIFKTIWSSCLRSRSTYKKSRSLALGIARWAEWLGLVGYLISNIFYLMSDVGAITSIPNWSLSHGSVSFQCQKSNKLHFEFILLCYAYL